MVRPLRSPHRLTQWTVVSICFCLILLIYNRPVTAEQVSRNLSQIFAGSAPKTTADLREMQNHIQKLAKKVNQATVHLRLGPAHGSGVIVSRDGMILTAAHVAGRPGKRATIILSDGSVVHGKSLGLHFKLDAGMVKIADEGTWPYLKMAEPQVSNGQWCAATGHPGGFEPDRSPVFRLGRVLDHGKNKLIRTDCQLIGGDSGGPLVDMYGEVIGIHSRIGSNLANNQHVPIAAYLDHWKQLVSGETLGLGTWMGVSAANGKTSATVSSIHKNSPAKRAGIRVGDVITHFDGQSVGTFKELKELVQLRKPGERVSIRVRRDGHVHTMRVKLGQRGL